MELDSGNTALVLDSTADFPGGPQRFPSWRVVPLYVRFGADSFRDYVDLSPSEFYARLRSAPDLPTTSQPTPADFTAAYEGLGGFARIYSFHIPAKLSGTWQSARTAAEAFGDRIRVVDTGSASAGIAMLALAVQRRLARGTTDEEVEELIDRFRREAELVFTLETLEFLAKGGRIGKARGWAGQLLHIKPIMTIEEGEVEPLKRVRGNRRAFKEFQDAFTARSRDNPGLRVAIAHADAPQRLAELEKMVRDVRPQATIDVEAVLGPVIGTHAGPGAVGLFWFQDD